MPHQKVVDNLGSSGSIALKFTLYDLPQKHVHKKYSLVCKVYLSTYCVTPPQSPPVRHVTAGSI